MKSTSLESIVGPGSDGEEARTASLWPRRMARMVPWILLLGFALLAWLLFGDLLYPAKQVQLETVVTVRQSADVSKEEEASGGEDAPPTESWDAPMLFQASGWIEPAPLPIKATALVNGVVDSVSILEGESVSKGQVLATLIREDFELDVETAKSDLASLHAQAEAHESAIDAALARIITLDKQVEAGQKKCLELEDRQRRLEKAGAGAISQEALTLARLRLDTHASEVEALEISRVELESDVARLKASRMEFSSMIRRAETEVVRRQLALDRTEIKSPVDGVILRLLAVPGQKRMLEMDDEDSATVAILYQPDSLQARIDVPLEEAAKLAVGQLVRLRSNFLPDRVFQGKVTRIVGEADLQRNTLQVKVRVTDPDHRLRPDMLCRAEFLAGSMGESGESVASGNEGSQRIALYVAERALVDQSQNQAEVWSIDSSGEHLERRSIKLGQEKRDGYLLVLSGLRPGDRVVVDPSSDLSEGDRISASGGGEES